MFGWTRDHLDVNIAPFTGEAKLNIDLQNFEPLDFFKLFINDGFIDELVTQTYKYVETLVNNEGIKENSRTINEGISYVYYCNGT